MQAEPLNITYGATQIEPTILGASIPSVVLLIVVISVLAIIGAVYYAKSNERNARRLFVTAILVTVVFFAYTYFFGPGGILIATPF